MAKKPISGNDASENAVKKTATKPVQAKPKYSPKEGQISVTGRMNKLIDELVEELEKDLPKNLFEMTPIKRWVYSEHMIRSLLDESIAAREWWLNGEISNERFLELDVECGRRVCHMDFEQTEYECRNSKAVLTMIAQLREEFALAVEICDLAERMIKLNLPGTDDGVNFRRKAMARLSALRGKDDLFGEDAKEFAPHKIFGLPYTLD